jgi:cytochrome c
MASLEWNKLFAAALIVGITVWGTRIVAKHLFADDGHPGDAAPKHAYEIAEGVRPVETSAAAPAAAVINPIAPLLASASVEEGFKVARKCSACHSFDKGGVNKIGPNLWDIVGAKHAHIDSFAYSSALKTLPGLWDYESLNKFLYEPKTYAPGTKMGFAGLKNDKERADMILYLRSLADKPIPLP